MEPTFSAVSLSALPLALVPRLQPQPPQPLQQQQLLLPPPPQCPPQPQQQPPQPPPPPPRPPQLQQTCGALATQCQDLQQESPACSPSPGRGRPSTPAPRRGTTRASSGAPPWSTRRATTLLVKDNMDSALKHATRDSGGSRENIFQVNTEQR